MPNQLPGRALSRPRQRAAFTLAELMAVTAIIGIMIVVAATSINGLSRGASLRGATLQLKSALNLTRQYAITHRQPTGLLFPLWQNDQQAADPTKTKAFRAYAIYSISNGPSLSTTNLVSDWHFLPPGVVILTNSAIYTNASASLTLGSTNTGLQDGNNIPFLCFKTDGSLVSGIIDANIVLGEGSVSASGAQVCRTNAFTNRLTIHGLTGAVKVQ